MFSLTILTAIRPSKAMSTTRFAFSNICLQTMILILLSSTNKILLPFRLRSFFSVLWSDFPSESGIYDLNTNKYTSCFVLLLPNLYGYTSFFGKLYGIGDQIIYRLIETVYIQPYTRKFFIDFQFQRNSFL